MATDLFNNTSNDYINPSLPQCPGDADSYTFEFLTGKKAGIVSGSSIIASMELGDISQEVTGWVQQTKMIESGEVIFIQGLTKGISERLQRFLWDGSALYESDYHSLYLSLDLSINYYKNFRYYENALHVTSDSSQGITIENALNIKFGELGINITAAYDASGLTFTGGTAGYSFDITRIDVSLWAPDVSIGGSPMVEDTSSAIPAFKYPNGAMLGYILKATYPSTAAASDSYIKINHVPDYLVFYEPSAGDANSYVRYRKAVDVGLNGFSTATTLSAGDYLDKVESNQAWEKVGVLRAWLSAEDPTDSNVENLITGFYVFNPQPFAVRLDYMTLL